MSSIIIGRPYISDNGSKVKLCSDIVLPTGTKTLYFEVERDFKEFLLVERCDAFLIALLNSCLYEKYDIICDALVSEQLLFQIRNFYIPIMTSSFDDMYEIHINASETTNELINSKNMVGTGNSGGVDSTFTMLKYSDPELKSFKLTHTLFTNISTNDFDDERIRKTFEKDCIMKKEASKSLGLTFVSVYSNMYSFYSYPGIFNHYFTQQYCSAAIALNKLFGTYYFSSTFKINDFSLNKKIVHSSGRYDIFSLDTLSTNNLRFYSAGMEVDRMEKLNFILDNDYTKHYLQVCSEEQSTSYHGNSEFLNCGYCNKCGRMIGIFYALGKLSDYSKIFDLEYFYKNKAKFIARNLEADQGIFAKSVKRLLKKNHKYPAFTDFYRLLYRMRYRLAKNNKLVSFYHKFKHNKEK